MAQFFTEFPCNKSVSADDFICLLVDWLKGIKNSVILQKVKDDIAKIGNIDEIASTNGSGEKLVIKRCIESTDVLAIGFQHDLPDNNGLLWRTEVVFQKSLNDAFITIRVNCLSQEDGVQILEPKRPYIVKMMLKQGWGEDDGEFKVSDAPHYLTDVEIDKAKATIDGQSTVLLPIVYVSSPEFEANNIDVTKLAYDLGGISHVIVEPSREFSFKLKDVCGEINPYNGAIGVSLPQKANIIRIIPERVQFDEFRFRQNLIDLISSRIPRFGIDWAVLQERIAQAARTKLERRKDDTSKDNLDDWINSFQSEIDAKNQKIESLTSAVERLENQKLEHLKNSDNVVNFQILNGKIPQIYPGEIGDPVKILLSDGSGPLSGRYTERDAHVFGILDTLISSSGKLGDFKETIKKLVNKPKELGKFLGKTGWTIRSDGKHYVLNPPSDLRGIGSFTMPKTPSDHRARQNNFSDVKKALGIQSLKP